MNRDTNVVIRISNELVRLIKSQSDVQQLNKIVSRHKSSNPYCLESFFNDLKTNLKDVSPELENVLSGIEMVSLLNSTDSSDRLSLFQVCVS